MQETKYLSKEQETESKHFKDPATNLDLEVTDKVRPRCCVHHFVVSLTQACAPSLCWL